MDFLMKSQYWNLAQLQDLQLYGLKELVDWAKLKCPFYKDLPEIRSLDDLKDIPVLTKTIINKNFNNILVPEVPHVLTTTGGTISKTTVAGDKRLLAGWEEYRFMSWYPVSTIKRMAYLWGSVETGQQARKLGNKFWLPVEGLINKVVAVDYLEYLGKFKPDYLKAYAGPMYVLARYAQEMGMEKTVKGKVGVIATHCETLTKQMRDVISDVFGCQVFNFYGARDLGSQAQDCTEHGDLHLCAERYIVEVVDGKFLFTDLLNYASLLIRYENQDIGEFGEPCPCGRGLPTIKPLVGRVLHYLQTKNGDWISGFIIYLPVMYYDVKFGTRLFGWVEAYQIRQREQGKITILLKPWEHTIPPVDLTPQLEVLKKYAKPEEFDVDIQIVNDIPRSATGKQLAVDTTLKRWEI
jgi:phenylacetate-CoA ligase